MKQVLSSLYKRNIQRLTQTYLTLSLQDIANTVQLENSKQAEMHVLQMVVKSSTNISTFHFGWWFYHEYFLCELDSRWRYICNNQPEGWNGQFSRGSWTIQNLRDDWAHWCFYSAVCHVFEILFGHYHLLDLMWWNIFDHYLTIWLAFEVVHVVVSLLVI